MGKLQVKNVTLKLNQYEVENLYYAIEEARICYFQQLAIEAGRGIEDLELMDGYLSSDSILGKVQDQLKPIKV